MAASKLLVLSVLFSLAIHGVLSEASIEASEVETLRSRISAIEANIADKVREIEKKEESIMQLESVVREKSAVIAVLESEIHALQKKGDVNTKELEGKTDARVGKLEKQIAKLRNAIELQSKRRVALETRASEAEKQVKEMDMKLEVLHKFNEEQKQRIRKTQRALEVAEEQLMRAQLDATSKLKELKKVHGAWLPPWLAAHTSYIQDLAVTHWNEDAKPALIILLQKASETIEQVQKWAEPHLDRAKTKLIPAVKGRWIAFKINAEPHLQKISSKTVEVYETSLNTIIPHILKAQELADPYFQEAKEFSKPYIDQVVVVTKPHVENARFFLKPYKKHVVRMYGKCLKTAKTYHHQVHANVHEKLKKHDLTKPIATKELAWFMASALLALPLFFLYRLLLTIFCSVFCSKKPKKLVQKAHPNHAPRRPKRRHADK